MQGRRLFPDIASMPQPVRLKLGAGLVAVCVVCLVDLIGRYGPDGLVLGGTIALVVVYLMSHYLPPLLSLLRQEFLPSPEPMQTLPVPAPAPVQKTKTLVPPVQEEDYPDTVFVKEDMDWSPPRKRSAKFEFSEVLQDFVPSLDAIYLAEQMDGSAVTVSAKQLCHVALAGATWAGKSNCIRLIMAQLCRIGVHVLLLNPHYTHYDLEHNEDWTPYKPYLLHDPMDCSSYEVIEQTLRQVATDLLPKRLDKLRHSQPLGRPYFIILDELPAIVKHVQQAPEYLEDILREGRKVGLFVVSAAQDYLVKTIAPQGSGAIRDCYLTAIYSGGDATTAKVLLDLSSSQIPEDKLGQGMVMIRTFVMKQAALGRVPLMDNAALYQLLGPSTFEPSAIEETVEDDLPVYPVAAPRERIQPVIHVPTRQLTVDLQAAFEAYVPGMSYRELGKKLGVGKDKAGDMLKELKERRLV